MEPRRATSVSRLISLSLAACLAFLPNVLVPQPARSEGFATWHELLPLRIQPHDEVVRAIAFSPDGKRIASGSYDHSICVMDSPQDLQRPSEVLLRIQGHGRPVIFLTFDSTGGRILSRGQDMHVRLWHAADGTSLWEANAHGPVALHPEGRTVAIADDYRHGAAQGTIRLVELPDGTVRRTLDGHAHFVRGIAFSPDGKQLISSGPDGFVRLWSTTDGELLQSARGAGGSFSFGNEVRVLASASSRGTRFYVWSFPELKLLHEWHSDPVIDLAFIADARVLAVCTTTDVSPSLTLQLFRVSDGARLQSLVHERVRTTSIALHPDGKLLAAGMSDGSIRFFAPGRDR